MMRFLRLTLLCFLLIPTLVLSAQDAEETAFALFDTFPAMNFNGDAGAMIEYDGRFHMFANVYDSLPSTVEIHYFVSANGTSWVQRSVDPILTVDAYTAFASDVVVAEDGTWMLYFSTWLDEADITGSSVGLATSSEPNGDWTIVSDSVLAPSDDGWDAAFASAASVVQNDDGYAMYYSGGNAVDDLAIGYATSDDGVSWTKQAEPLITTLGNSSLRPQFQLVWHPNVIEIDMGYFMIFRSGTGLTEPGGGMVRYGQSSDGLEWTMDVDLQAYRLGEIEGAAIGATQILNIEGTIYLFMAVENEGTSQIYVATLEEPRFDVSILDISNNNNASDIEIKLPNITDYEIHLRHADSDTSIVLDDSQYDARISLDARDVRIRLSESLVDNNGEVIVEGVPYMIDIFDTISGELLFGETITLANENTVRTVIAGLNAASGGIDIDSDGNIYLADFGEAGQTTGTTVFQITPDGVVNNFLEQNGLLIGTGNVFDDEGNFYQSSFRGNMIVRVAADGEVSPFATTSLAGPVGIAINDEGNFLVANCSNGSIAQITPDGESSILVTSALFACANGITLDDDGNIYVANFSNSNVIKVTPDGDVSVFATFSGNNLGHVIYHDGLLYVVGRGIHQMYTITLDGEIELLAGTGERGNADGSALEATFSLPNDLIFSADGSELYINEGDALTTGRNHPAFIRAIVFARGE